MKKSLIGIGNVLTSYSATVNSSDAQFLADYLTTTFYSATGTAQITATCPTSTINFVGIGPSNWQQAGLTIELQLRINNVWTVKDTRSYTDGLRDDQPVLFTFDDIAVTGVRLFVTSNGVSSKISVLNAGLGVWLPKVPDLGYMPGEFNSLDEVTNAFTEGGAIGASRVLPRGFEEMASFSDIEQIWLVNNWPNVTKWRGYPMFFAYNPDDHPLSVIYGQWNENQVMYNNPNHTGLILNITGLA